MGVKEKHPFEDSESSMQQNFNLRKSDEVKLDTKGDKKVMADSMEGFFKSNKNFKSSLGFSKQKSSIAESNVVNKFRTDESKFKPTLKSLAPIDEEDNKRNTKKKRYEDENMEDSMLASLNETGN